MPWEQTDDEMSKASSGSGIKRAKTAVSSAVKGTGRGIRKVLNFGRVGEKKDDDMSTVQSAFSAPPNEIRTDVVVQPSESYEDSELPGLQFYTPSSGGSAKETVKVTGLAKESPYYDDNDKEQQGGFCEPCEGCAIL